MFSRTVFVDFDCHSTVPPADGALLCGLHRETALILSNDYCNKIAWGNSKFSHTFLNITIVIV